MPVKTSIATVFHGGRRRWLSLDAACRADAKQIIKQGGDDDSDQEYMASVARLAAVARAEFALLPAQSPAPPEQRALPACQDLVAATAEVKRLSRLIGESLSACPMARDDAECGPKGPITHLSLAYASETVDTDHGYGGTHKEWNSQHLLDHCPHCLAAHNAIQERKVARKCLGAARRAVTMIGKSS